MHTLCENTTRASYDGNNDNMQKFAFFLYGGFCIASFFIPDSVGFGESLSFAYTYAMVQVLEVGLFTGSTHFVVIGIVFASVLPTLQILQGLQNSYTVNIDNIYGELYMAKEIILYSIKRNSYTHRSNLEKSTKDSIASWLVCVWAILDLVFWFTDTNAAYKTMIQKSMYIARFSPVFGLAILNI
jgi:hypothetical protein